MLRFINISLLLMIVAMIVFLHQLKYESRLLEDRSRDLAAAIEKERDSIAVLKAELSLLLHPKRIERLAKKHLNLEVVKPEQVVTVEWLANVNKKKKQVSASADSVQDGIESQ